MYQVAISIIVALVFLGYGSDNAISSLYGGFMSIINTLLLARSVNIAGEAAVEQDRGKGALVLAKSVIMRFALVLIAFYIGIVHLELAALQTLIAFSLAQLGYIFYKSQYIY